MKVLRSYRVDSTGHGSDWLEGKERYTLLGAIREANWWFSYADTIGGTARVVNVRTGIKIYHWPWYK